MELSYRAIFLQIFLLISSFTLVFAMFGAIGLKLLQKKEQKLREELIESLRSLISAPDESTPSPLAVYSDQVATLMAARLVQQVKAMLAGTESGVSKELSADLLEGATDGNPWLGLIAGIIPKKLRNQLMKNPQMLGALSKLGGNHNQGNSADTQPRKHRE
jgi:DNA topoisomerase VI subunit B